jgi:hypothetical protein
VQKEKGCFEEKKELKQKGNPLKSLKLVFVGFTVSVSTKALKTWK